MIEHNKTYQTKKRSAGMHPSASCCYTRHLIIETIAGEILFDGEDYLQDKIKGKYLMTPKTREKHLIYWIHKWNPIKRTVMGMKV